MTKNTGIIIGIVVLFLISGGIYLFLKMNIISKEKSLRIMTEKQEKVAGIVFDDMWKIIKKQAKVPEHFKNDYKELILADNTTTYGDKGLQINGFMSTIQKTNPTFTPDMYNKLMQTIESEMKRFEREQKTLIALSEQHDLLLVSPLGSWFLEGIQPVGITLITSGKTKEAYKTGEDNDTDVFDDEKKTPVDSIK